MKVYVRNILATVTAIMFVCAAHAVSWDLGAVPAPGYYEFYSIGQFGEGGYSIDISATDTVSEDGETLHLVTSTTWGYQALNASVLQPGAVNSLLMNPASFMMFMIPMFIDDMDMEPGERAVIPGFGRVTVREPEVHGGITGHAIVIEERDSDDEWRPLMFLVFNESVSVPLVSAYYEDGELVSETKLVEFREY